VYPGSPVSSAARESPDLFLDVRSREANGQVREGANGFVLKEADGSYICFHRILHAPNLAKLLD
jgi:hypothetical protein